MPEDKKTWYMKSNSKLFSERAVPGAIVLLTVAGLLFCAAAGCSKAENDIQAGRKHDGNSPEASGKKTSVFFKPYVDYPEEGTKAADNSVRNIIISVYGEGSLMETLDMEAGTGASVELEIGREYSFYASANIARDEIPVSEQDLLKTRVSVSSGEPSGGFPMAATGTFSVTEENLTVSVLLQRLYSKIRFRVDFSDVPDLEITSANIRQAANSVLLFGESKAVLTTDGDAASAAELSALNSGSEIGLYLPENCQGVLLPDNDASASKVPDNIPGKADVCSYIEVTGKLNGENSLFGPVTYRFYLGQDTTSDFSVIRNTDNEITLIPSRESISAPTWQVDSKDVYGKMPVLTISQHQYYFIDEDGIETHLMPETELRLQWHKLFATDDYYIAIAESPGGYDPDNIFDEMMSTMVARSEDGKTWEEIGKFRATDIAYGNGTYIITSGKNRYRISIGGKLWNALSADAEMEIVTYGNGIFMGFGDDYYSYTSEDGIEWTKAGYIGLSPGKVVEAAYVNGEFVCITWNSKIARSKDNGKTWTITQSNVYWRPSVDLYSIELTYGNGIYLLSAYEGLFYSTDGNTWANVPGIGNGNCFGYSIDYKDGVFSVAFNEILNNSIYVRVFTSLNGRDWTQIYDYNCNVPTMGIRIAR